MENKWVENFEGRVWGAKNLFHPPQRNERKYDGTDALPERALNV